MDGSKTVHRGFTQPLDVIPVYHICHETSGLSSYLFNPFYNIFRIGLIVVIMNNDFCTLLSKSESDSRPNIPTCPGD
jgi:hypothetical protein